jgi:hypothetical protein
VESTAYVEDFEKGQAYNISSFPNSPYLAVKRHGHGWSISPSFLFILFCHKNLHQYPGLELITICQRVDYIYRIGGSPIGISLFVNVANGKGQSRMNNPDTKMYTKHSLQMVY